MPTHEAKRLTMHSVPNEDRPRERLFAQGAAVLSNAELLAIILRTGSAQENVVHLAERILARYEGLQGLGQATPADLLEIKGLGEAKIAQIIAAIELFPAFFFCGKISALQSVLFEQLQELFFVVATFARARIVNDGCRFHLKIKNILAKVYQSPGSKLCAGKV